MLVIRSAILADIPQVAGLIRLHYDSTRFPQELPYDAQRVIDALEGLIYDPLCELLVAADEDHLVGTIGLQITGTFFTPALAAREHFLYVKPEYRGHRAGMKLVAAAEEWAKILGANVIVIGNHPLSPDYVAAVYERHGYREAQTDFIKRL